MKKVAVAALLVSLVFVGLAAGAYQLRFGYAKRAIQRSTANVCENTEECYSWTVRPCRRRSPHRIDCLSTAYFRDGVACEWVTIAILPPSAYDVQVRHKRIRC